MCVHGFIHDGFGSLMRRHDAPEPPAGAAERAAANLVQARRILGRRGLEGHLESASYLPERTRLWAAAVEGNMEGRLEEDRLIEPLREHWSPEQAPAYDVLFGAARGWKALKRVAQVGLGLSVLAAAAAYTFPVSVPFGVVSGLVAAVVMVVLLGVVGWRVHVEEDRALLDWGLEEPGRMARGIPGWTRDSGWVAEGTLLAFACTLVLLVALLANALVQLVTWAVEAPAAGFPLEAVLALLVAWVAHRLAAVAGRRLRIRSAMRDDAFSWLGWVDEEDHSDGRRG